MNAPLRGWRRPARRRWLAELAAERDALVPALQAARETPPDRAAVASRLRRAAVRAEAPALRDARLAGLAAALAWSERVRGRPWDDTLRDAALALRLGGAVELATQSARRDAIALAAASAALGGGTVHVVAAHDDDAADAARAAALVLGACGLEGAALSLEMSPDALAAGHRRPVVFAGVRRLAADIARDTRMVQQLGADAPVPQIVPAVRQAFVEPLDRVLADDALGPIVLSVPDDPTRFGDALAAACRFVDTLRAGIDHDGPVLTDAGRARLAAARAAWPPVWRGAQRSEALAAQALHVRDGLVAGRDYLLLGTGGGGPGNLWLDDGLVERLPDRDWASGLLQAVQLRAGLPATPVTRTVGRSSVPAFFAHYAQLAGSAPCLEGLDGELWSAYGLHRFAPAPLPATPCRTLAVADGAAADLALQALAAEGDPADARLMVLRRAADAPRLQALVTHPRAAWALESLGPAPALQALCAQVASQPAAPPVSGARVVFVEPADHARAERAWLLRTADALPGEPAAPQAVRVIAADGRWLAQRLPWSAACVAPLCRAWPALAPRLLPPLVALAQALAARRARAHRTAMPERERQLQRQLSFTSAASPAASTHRGRSP